MENNNIGRLIAQGSGKGSKAVFGWAAYKSAVAAISFRLACEFYPGAVFLRSIERIVGLNSGAGILAVAFVCVLFVIFMAAGLLNIIYAFIIVNSISKTRIEIYEYGIAGKGLPKPLYWGSARTADFTFTYEQISVEVRGEQIVIHASGARYRVYAANAREIQKLLPLSV